MEFDPNQCPVPLTADALDELRTKAPSENAEDWQLQRWLVSFRSGAEWYPVGEFTAVDAPAAIERAVAVFGPGEGYQAEHIPWDAASLPSTPQRTARPMS